MEKPPHCVVDSLRFGESLVSTLMTCKKSLRVVRCNACSRNFTSHTNDPEPSAYQSDTKAIERPKSVPNERVGVRVRVLNMGRVNQRLNGDGGPIDDGEQKEVPESGGEGWSVHSVVVGAKARTRRVLIVKQSA